LTGTPFFVLTLLFLVGSMAAAVLLWRRLRGRAPHHILGRISVLMLSQAAAVLVVLVAINNTFGLYSNWNDVFGGSVGQGDFVGGKPVAAGAGSITDPAGITPRHHTHKVVNHLDLQKYDGRFTRTVVVGRHSGLKGEVAIYTPPQYDDPAYADRDFPVLELLHGIPGSYTGWVGPMKVESALEQAMATKRIQPFILVVPTIDPGGNTLCSDIPNGPRTDTWLSQDVRQLILANFRAGDTASSWGLMGYSTGGFCAVKLAVEHPQLFHAAVSMAGDDFAGDPHVFHNNRTLQNLNSPLWQLAHMPVSPQVALLLQASRKDPTGLIAYNEKLASVVRAPTQVAKLYYPTGGHSQTTWRQFLPDALNWINTELPGGAT
jgi:enterochelin esterase-like enzyme